MMDCGEWDEVVRPNEPPADKQIKRGKVFSEEGNQENINMV